MVLGTSVDGPEHVERRAVESVLENAVAERPLCRSTGGSVHAARWIIEGVRSQRAAAICFEERRPANRDRGAGSRCLVSWNYKGCRASRYSKSAKVGCRCARRNQTAQ